MPLQPRSRPVRKKAVRRKKPVAKSEKSRETSAAKKRAKKKPFPGTKTP